MILITSDLHFDDKPLNAYRHDFQTRLRDEIKRRKVKVLLVLGDITEHKDYHSAELVNKIVDHLCELARLCLVVILRGNHDGTDPNTPFFGFVQAIENIVWVNDVTRGGSIVPELKRTLFVPHTRDYKRDWTNVDFTKHDWIFTHNTFDGADTGTGFKLSGIPTSVFPEDAHIISGDIHTPQTLGPVTYVGCPYTCDFGDDYVPRILHITDRGKLESIPCSGPQKRLVEFTDGMALLKGEGAKAGDILKVRVHITLQQQDVWPEIKQQVQNWADGRQMIVHNIQPVMAAERKRKQPTQITKQTDASLLERYGKQRKVGANLLKTGRWLMDRT